MKLEALAALTAPMALTAASFTRQRNADVFGCADIGAHFKNRYSSNICFVDDPANPPADNPPADNLGSEIRFASQADFDAAVRRIIGAQTPPADNPPANPTNPPADDKKSIYEQRKAAEAAEAAKKAEHKQIEDAIMFDTQFDTFLKDNAKFFPDTSKTIRADVEKNEEDQIKRSNLMAATAAKEFFSNERNVKILEKKDQDYVTREVTNKRYESEIDGAAAWEIVKRAIYNHNLKNKHQAMRDTSGAGNGNYGYEKLDASLKAFYPEGVQAL